MELGGCFGIHIPIIAVALPGQVVVRESRDSRHVGLDVPGALTATLGISVLVFAIIQGTEQGWTSPLIRGGFSLAAALLVSFVVIEQRVSYPMLPLHFFFKNRDFTGSVAVISIMFYAGPATFFFLTQFFQIIQERSPFEAGLMIVPTGAGIVVASSLGPQLAKPLGPRRLVMISVGIMTVAAAIFTRVDADWTTLTAILVILLFGFGFGLGMPSLTDAVMASIPVEDSGVGSAVNDISRELGSALGIAIIGSFISGIYRSNVEERLAGQVPEEAVETAKEGLGVIAAASPSLPVEVAQSTFLGASQAFIDAMNSGFWLSAAVLASAVVVAFFLLPNETRALQVERAEGTENESEAR